jgi:hypothetical protein
MADKPTAKIVVDGVEVECPEVGVDELVGELTDDAKAEVFARIAAELDAMSPEERAARETERIFHHNEIAGKHLATLSWEERLERLYAFPTWLRVPKSMTDRPYETIFDMLARGVDHEAVGAMAALRAARRRNYRRPKPRSDGW